MTSFSTGFTNMLECNGIQHKTIVLLKGDKIWVNGCHMDTVSDSDNFALFTERESDNIKKFF